MATTASAPSTLLAIHDTVTSVFLADNLAADRHAPSCADTLDAAVARLHESAVDAIIATSDSTPPF